MPGLLAQTDEVMEPGLASPSGNNREISFVLRCINIFVSHSLPPSNKPGGKVAPEG